MMGMTSAEKEPKSCYNYAMHWIYLSPHLDDIALSCGGLVWQQARQGEAVSIWTICAGDLPAGPLSPFAQSLHDRWQASDPQFQHNQAPAHRRQEDLASCAILGATARHFPWPDCIYRRRPQAPEVNVQPAQSEWLYDSEEALWIPVDPAEAPLVEALRDELARSLPAQAEIVCPLAIGGHVDHRLTRAAAELLERPLWYYADYPYAADHPESLLELRQAGWQATCQALTEAALQAWSKSVAAHASQISTFWTDLEQMNAALQAFAQSQGGACLWRRT